jgi:hypothetical protein
VTAFALAWRTARRYRARAVLAVAGVAVIGALNFDMLMLSNGLLLSFSTLINSTGYNIRIAGSAGLPLARLPIEHASELLRQIHALPEVASVAIMRTATAAIVQPNRSPEGLELIGSSDPAGLGIWRQVSGANLDGTDGDRSLQPAVISGPMADRLKLKPGSTIHVRVRIFGSTSALPSVPLRVVGIAEFPFESADSFLVATTMEGFRSVHGGVLNDEAELMFAESRAPASPDAAVAAIAGLRSDLRAFSNEQIIANFGRNAFTYFRQISVVLSTTTAAF